MIDKKIVQKNFSSKAGTYCDLALIQKEAAQKLCDLAKSFIKNDAVILDLGSGTSFIAKNLTSAKNNYKIFEVDISAKMLEQWRERPKNVSPILADIENLPFEKTETFDVIFASFSLQWIENFDELFKNLSRLLKKNGLLALCLPCSRTFAEIKSASIKSGCNFYLKNLPSHDLITKNLLKNNFVDKINYTDQIIKTYISATEALREIKRIGANYSATKNFVTKNKLQKFNDFFAKEFKNITSWEISYLIQKKEIDFLHCHSRKD